MSKVAEHSSTTHSPSAAQSESASPFFGHATGWDNDARSTAEPFFTQASIQPKLKVGAPNDKYEQEADSVANQVVQRLAQPATEAVTSPTEAGQTTDVQAKTKAAPNPILPTISRIQRSAEPELQEKSGGESEGEEPTLQRKPIFESDGDVQRQPIFESESVQRQPNGAISVQRQCSDCETKAEGMVRRMPFASPAPKGIQRKCAACEAEEKVQPKRVPVLQRIGDGSFTASDDFSSRLSSSRGGGSPLPSETRRNMEGAIGADFSGVRVHTGSQAAGLSDEIGAKAFTHGNDVYFNSGQYNPSSSTGQHLLAHELTHTVQQGGSGVKRREFAPTEYQLERALGDWTHADRIHKTDDWKAANAFNLENGRNNQYVQIDQRRDFYLWFFESMTARGHEIRWPLAAYIVAGGANEGANRDFAGLNFVRNNNLEALLRRGNQVIFDDVFPKLRQLYLQSNILTGAEALGWDMRILIQEQNLIQPLYEGLSEEELNTMAGIARQEGFLLTVGSFFFGSAGGGEYHEGGGVPGFPGDYELTNPEHRFRYGMLLAHYFTSETRDVATSKVWAEGLVVPEIPADYQNGEALRRVDRFGPVHRLAAEISDIGVDIDRVREAVHAMTDEQRAIVANDPWFIASLRHRHRMSPAAAQALLNSSSIENCGNLFQVIGTIESVGTVTEEDQIIVWVADLDGWQPHGGGERVQAQAVSDTAYERFPGVPLRWVWKDSLRCYPRHEPTPIPDPIERHYRVFFDTGNAAITGDTNEFDNRLELNHILSTLAEYGESPRVDNLNLYITGHASPRWRTAPTGEDAALENEALARERAGTVENYLTNGYSEYQGPIPLAVLDPDTNFQMFPANPLPADAVISGGRGSTEGLEATEDPDNDDSIYRRVDVRVTIIFSR